jgi:phenylacetate-coenzyme A ligase PaaK-like adenylate-forming protein
LAALGGAEASALIARPETLSLIAQAALEAGRSYPHIQWLIVAGSTPPNPKEAAAWIALAPAARVARIHGQSECPMAFVESARPVATMAEAPETGTGFIVHPDLCILEIIDPDTLQPVAEGQPGEVVYTSLIAHGRALLRYRTGDWAVNGLIWTPDSHGNLPRLSSQLQPLKSHLQSPSIP